MDSQVPHGLKNLGGENPAPMMGPVPTRNWNEQPLIAIPPEMSTSSSNQQIDSLKEELKKVSQTVIALASQMSNATQTSSKESNIDQTVSQVAPSSG